MNFIKKENTTISAWMVLATLLFSISTPSLAKTPTPCTPKADQPVDDITFVAYDTETTGFSPYAERIIELGAVKFKNGKILEEKNWLIKPGKKISYWAEKAHGISNKQLEDSPSFVEVYPEFVEFAKDCVLFAHNATFDVGFLREEIARNKLKPMCEPTLDTLRLFRTWWPDSESHTVKSLTELLDIKTGVFHRATDDSRYTIKVFDAGLDEQPKKYAYSNLVQDAGGELFFSK
jgi:DNA polymerase III epsilon subunit family exonuclease